MLALLKKALRPVAVTLALPHQAPEHHKSTRAKTLAVIFVASFALTGSDTALRPLQFLAHAPFELDWALRTLSLGLYDLPDTVPISMVEIGEATHRAWGSPAMTPRDDLARILNVVTRSNPAAVVVDIDLSFHGGNDGILRQFLQTYRGPAPMIFPKRIEPGAGDTRRLASSPFDDIIAGNPRLLWAHASFETNKGGAVRQWTDWLEVCTDRATLLLPSVTVQLEAVLARLPRGMERPKPPPMHDSCQRAMDAPGQLLLVGPRLTGPQRHSMPEVQWVSALSLLDPELERDDAALFGDRIVFIGATHSASGDFWLTPAGVLPGVELIANTVRYAPLRVETGQCAELALRATVLGVFAMFAWLLARFRPIVGIGLSILGGLLIVYLFVRVWHYLRVFEAIELSILLFLEYKVAQLLLDLWADIKWKGLGRAMRGGDE